MDKILESPLEGKVTVNRMVYFQVQQPKQRQSIYFSWAAKRKSLQSIGLFSDGKDSF